VKSRFLVLYGFDSNSDSNPCIDLDTAERDLLCDSLLKMGASTVLDALLFRGVQGRVRR
jgi:hypothetical protein